MSYRNPTTTTYAGEISTCSGTYTRINNATHARFFLNGSLSQQAMEQTRRLIDSVIYSGEVANAGHIFRICSETSVEFHLGQAPLNANSPNPTMHGNAQYREQDDDCRGTGGNRA
ncbi:hypothetical protein B0H17DRAFT_1126146 [Mycena rosella]|uniref:Uncharacterized protein n=1 Tax=Mycena rosella TaxID=1033263 RepID=A0AAD7M842_MYCRO|nr:hypothetical protein B0H17DRAFT_1126146 [Mycena rosella]